jgi:hypothetical protein
LARPYLEKTLHKKGLVKWVQMQTLNSSPNTTKKKKKKSTGVRRSWKSGICWPVLVSQLFSDTSEVPEITGGGRLINCRDSVTRLLRFPGLREPHRVF